MRFILYLIAIFMIITNADASSIKLVTLDSPPAEFRLKGKSTGRNVEITEECLKRMGFEATVEIIPWKRALYLVKTGGADAIIDAAFNSDRAEYLFYPDEELYEEQWYAFKRKGSPLTLDRGLKNAEQFTLGITRGFEYGGMIQEAINSRRFKKLEIAVNYEMNIKKLIGKRFDILIGVRLTVLNLIKKMGLTDAIEIVPMTETNQPYLLSSSKTYVAFSRKTMSQDIADLFSSTLKGMKEDGTVDFIEKKYF